MASITKYKDCTIIDLSTNMKDFETYSIPSSLQCPAVFLFGSDDWPVGIEEAKKLAHTYKAKFELISNTHHELTTEYINIISRYI